MGIKLPDLEYTVKANTAQMDVTAAKVEVLGDLVQKKLEPAGQAFVKFGEKGELASVRISSATARTGEDLDKLEARTRAFAETFGKDLEAGATAVIKLGEDGEAAFSKLGQTVESSAAPAMSGLASALADFNPVGLATIAVVVGLATEIGLALAPAVASLAGQLAVLTLGGGILGAFGLLAAGAVALTVKTQGWADASANLTKAQEKLKVAQDAVNNSLHPTKTQLEALTKAQQELNDATKAADNPWTKLTDHIGKAANALGGQLAPAASKILGFINGLVDPIAAVGSSLASWFGDRLPKVLNIAQDLFDALGEAGQRLANGLGPIFDKLISDPVGFEKAFQKTADEVVDAVIGIVRILDRLATWWEGPEGQHMASQAGTIMTIVGMAIQGVIGVVSLAVEIVSKLGDAFSAFGNILHHAVNGALTDIDRLGNAIRNIPHPSLPGGFSIPGIGFAASGGPVVPNSLTVVGEEGPELLAMGSGGRGQVIPLAGGGTNMRPSERLLEDQNQLLKAILTAVTARPPGWSTAAYGRG